jgi:hypothetical protein
MRLVQSPDALVDVDVAEPVGVFDRLSEGLPAVLRLDQDVPVVPGRSDGAVPPPKVLPTM